MPNDDARSTTRFGQTAGRHAYDMQEVDSFLDRLEAALAHNPPTMTPEDVERQRFTPVWLRAGYEVGEVDSFLDRMTGELRRRHAAAGSSPPAMAAAERRPAAPTDSGIPAREELGAKQPAWVRFTAVVALVALLAFLALQIR